MNRKINWSAAVIAGIVAGLVFVALEMFLVPLLLGGSPFGPPRMIAAIAMGREVLPPPATFDASIFAVAVLVHLILSVIYTAILTFFIRGRARGVTLALGGAFGLGLYVINFYLMTFAFPWFVGARNFVTIFSHLIFGLVAAWLYHMRDSQLTVAQPVPKEPVQPSAP